MADVPTDGFGGIFLSYSRADSSGLAVYQNYFDRITSTVSQGSDPRSLKQRFLKTFLISYRTISRATQNELREVVTKAQLLGVN